MFGRLVYNQIHAGNQVSSNKIKLGLYYRLVGPVHNYMDLSENVFFSLVLWRPILLKMTLNMKVTEYQAF